MAHTLQDALDIAFDHWSLDRPGSKSMRVAAEACVTILGPLTDSASVSAPHAVRLLAALRSRKLAPKSVGVYYGAFKRVLTLAGYPPPSTWPRPPTAPRRTRDRMSWEDLDRLITWLEAKGWSNTADLAVLLRATGLRVNVEALTAGNLRVLLDAGPAEDPAQYDAIHVTGKGGHERVIPVVASDARALLRVPLRLDGIRSTSYEGHLNRWTKGVSAVGITSRLATPHSVRHGYASEVLSNTGGNLIMVQDLLGHSQPATTARYLSVDMSAKAKGVTRGG